MQSSAHPRPGDAGSPAAGRRNSILSPPAAKSFDLASGTEDWGEKVAQPAPLPSSNEAAAPAREPSRDEGVEPVPLPSSKEAATSARAPSRDGGVAPVRTPSRDGGVAPVRAPSPDAGALVRAVSPDAGAVVQAPSLDGGVSAPPPRPTPVWKEAAPLRELAGLRVHSAKDDSPLRLSQVRGPVLFTLWALWCEPCVKELPMLQQLSAKYSQVSFRGIAQELHTSGSRAQVRALLAEKKVTYPQYLEEDGLTVEEHIFGKGIAVLPAFALYDGDGVLVKRIIGSLEASRENYDALVTELKRLGGRDPASTGKESTK